jgi:hypothetical protein
LIFVAGTVIVKVLDTSFHAVTIVYMEQTR